MFLSCCSPIFPLNQNRLMRKILFVDDEPNLLQGVSHILHAMRNEWEMYILSTTGQSHSDTDYLDGWIDLPLESYD